MFVIDGASANLSAMRGMTTRDVAFEATDVDIIYHDDKFCK
ncbi:MAG: hypothetical protein ACMG51_10515 [Ginsengibacter sp.]